MLPAISNTAAAPLPISGAAASFSSLPSPPSSPLPPSSSFPLPVLLDIRQDEGNYGWGGGSAWPSSLGGGNYYSYNCPPGVNNYRCWTTPTTTTPAAPATTTTPSPPPPSTPSTTVTQASTTSPVPPASAAPTTETAATPATDTALGSSLLAGGGGVLPTTTPTMSTATPFVSSASPVVSGSSSTAEPVSTSDPSHRTTVVILSSVLSVVGVVAVAALVFVCCRYRQRRGRLLFPRGISPIDDDEIQAWKSNSRGQPPPQADMKEKQRGGGELNEPNGGSGGLDSPPLLSVGVLGAGAVVERRDSPPQMQPGHRARGISLDSAGIAVGGSGTQTRPATPSRQPPSNVIIYRDPPQTFAGLPHSAASSTTGFPSLPQQNIPLSRRSEEIPLRSARSLSLSSPATRGWPGRFSFDQDRDAYLSQVLASSMAAPVALQHARAPNSRAGLTDETVPGDPSYLLSPKRRSSRLIKHPSVAGAGFSATRTATVAAAAPGTASGISGAIGPVFSPRRNSHTQGDVGDTGPQPSLPPTPRPNRNSAAFRQSRTRSARSSSIMSGRSFSYAASDLALNQSFSQPMPPRRQSLAQRDHLEHIERLQHPQHPQPVTPPQNSAAAAALRQNMPVPPPPVFPRANASSSQSARALSGQRSGSASSISSSSSTFPPRMGAVAADDSDDPLLGGLSPPRPRMPDSPPAAHSQSQSLGHLEGTGRAVI